MDGWTEGRKEERKRFTIDQFVGATLKEEREGNEGRRERKEGSKERREGRK
jgi:hypothetical protein